MSNYTFKNIHDTYDLGDAAVGDYFLGQKNGGNIAGTLNYAPKLEMDPSPKLSANLTLNGYNITGNLSVSNYDSGDNASSGTYLRGDGTWQPSYTPSELTKTDDTNVTITLGGNPTIGLVAPISMTVGWTGQLAVGRGGTGLSTYAQGDIVYASALNTLASLPKNTSATRYLSNTGVSNAPAWAQVDLSNGVTGQLPIAGINATGTPGSGNFLRGDGTWAAPSGSGSVNSGTINQLAYYAATGTAVSGLATANNGLLVTDGSGVPSIGNTIGAGITVPSVTFSSTTGIVGTTTNNNAAAGSVGEVISSIVLAASAVTMTSNTYRDITSISVPAGDWDISANVTYTNSSGTFTLGTAAINSVSATAPDLAYRAFFNYITAQANPTLGIVAPTRRVSISGTTTYYIGGSTSHTGTTTACGGIVARRRR